MKYDIDSDFDLMNARVIYAGDNRRDKLDGHVGRIVSVRRDAGGVATHYGVQYDNSILPGIEYAAVWAWVLAPEEPVPGFDIDKFFNEASGGPLAVAKAEITRLEERLAELKAAVKVIESL